MYMYTGVEIPLMTVLCSRRRSNNAVTRQGVLTCHQGDAPTGDYSHMASKQKNM